MATQNQAILDKVKKLKTDNAKLIEALESYLADTGSGFVETSTVTNAQAALARAREE